MKAYHKIQCNALHIDGLHASLVLLDNIMPAYDSAEEWSKRMKKVQEDPDLTFFK